VGDHLRLDATHAVHVTEGADGHRAEPVTAAGDGWSRSSPGDGAGLALLHRLRDRTAVPEGFRVTGFGWVAPDDESERPMGVDQTHDSWVVGGRVVVKWMTEPLVGPHPAAERLRRLAEAGFADSPELIGLVEWRDPDDGHWVPVAIVQSYLPGTEDGWVWGLREAREALGLVPGTSGSGFGSELGEVVGRLHLALADDPPERMTAALAAQYADHALAVLDRAVRLLDPLDAESAALLSRHRSEIEPVLAGLAETAGTPVLPAHGDLHVGQVLRTADRQYALVDFDGPPTSSAHLRATPAPAARDVAQMLVSVENLEYVVRRYHPDLPDEAGRVWTAGEQAAFVAGYRSALSDRGDLFDDALLPAYEWEQVCQEIVYAAERGFVDWLHVPAAELRRRLVPED
jgi:maltokinase